MSASRLKIIVESVRSLAREHRIEIRPLTILVGENSAGKSTFLAATAAVLDSTNFPGNPQLNRAPYDLGNFETIATYSGGKAGRAKSFKLGYSFEVDEAEYVFLAEYESHYGRFQLKQYSLSSPGGGFQFDIGNGQLKGNAHITRGQGKIWAGDFSENLSQSAVINNEFILNLIARGIMRSRIEQEGGARAYFEYTEFFQRILSQKFDASSVAPVRSKPRRTYDRISQEYDPQGDHVPFELARILLEPKGGEERAILQVWLQKFGTTSGLFQRVLPRRLGTKPGDPFKIEVTGAGRPANITDVGYGVSQSLPIIVQSLLGRRDDRVLLQQPEVHLHPRAQAALGTFFSELVAGRKREFVVETHSDYLIDRIRRSVSAQRLDPEAVNLVFFDKPGHESILHEIALDRQGNVLDAPVSYRQFFLAEQDLIFGD